MTNADGAFVMLMVHLWTSVQNLLHFPLFVKRAFSKLIMSRRQECMLACKKNLCEACIFKINHVSEAGMYAGLQEEFVVIGENTEDDSLVLS